MLESLLQEEGFDSFLQNNQDKLVLVKFSTVWCAPCQVLEKNIKELLNELGKATEQSKDLLVLQIDAEKFPRLAQRPSFSVYSLPTIFLYHQGKMIKKGTGSMNVQQLKEFVRI
jgi:thioredoxin-like negative regulator of GroEL